MPPKTIKDLTIPEYIELNQKIIRDEISKTPKTYLEGTLKDHFNTEIREIVHDELQHERENFWIPAERHYLDHKDYEKCNKNREEWEENHKFVSGMRKKGQKAWNIGFILAAVTIFGFIGNVFFDGFKQSLINFMSGGGKP